eukprot:gnl/MRDRNA2_/MRDRNA2_253502_c0_seq1.p1 gnl/MRDRNA2_/MRDRNA2_253502_c0~~gnl/MRDRNA2_/MRDRNA2_253502_c0_seq1.p1  ORF type:complete len:143 (-),score=26.61 gnl/MRDRNA2_/MRDRNA2_253502_c0_seq1:64-492(-)
MGVQSRMCWKPVAHIAKEAEINNAQESKMVEPVNNVKDSTLTAAGMLIGSKPTEDALQPAQERSDISCYEGFAFPSGPTSVLVAVGSGALAWAVLAHSLVLPCAGMAMARVALPGTLPSAGSSKKSRRAKHIVMQKYYASAK